MLASLAPDDALKIWEKLPFSVRPHQEELAEARGVLVKGYDPDGGVELHVIHSSTSPVSIAHSPGLFLLRTGMAVGGAGACGPVPVRV